MVSHSLLLEPCGSPELEERRLMGAESDKGVESAPGEESDRGEEPDWGRA